ncbi:hypothetical protein BU15DRAFT_72764 [Melanogaster broomeanus]|nr:hypothetical protein BU15DRAFT_72764 [Melanogaster broomeanus]
MSRPQQSTEMPLGSEPEQRHTQAMPPSTVVHPTTVDTARQQASTFPGDGGEVRADQVRKPSEVVRDDPNINVVELPPQNPTFREQVYGHAKVIRGTMLGQPDVKEHGEQVLRGEKTIPRHRGSQTSESE